VAHYLLNAVQGDEETPSVPERVAALMRAGMWGVDAAERHSDALAPGGPVLVYLAAPGRVLVGRAVIGSALHAAVAVAAGGSGSRP
jgi:hypothetical protein